MNLLGAAYIMEQHTKGNKMPKEAVAEAESKIQQFQEELKEGLVELRNKPLD